MNSHVSAILLGVKDMERSKRFYVDGLGWKVESDYKISVFFVSHGGTLVGFYGREGLADVRIIRALLESAEINRPVAVPQVDISQRPGLAQEISKKAVPAAPQLVRAAAPGAED